MASLQGQSPFYDIFMDVLWSAMLECTTLTDTDVLAEALVQPWSKQSNGSME